MTETEFAELTEGETVMTSQGAGMIRYFTEYGAGVEYEDDLVLNVKMEDLSRV